MNPDTTQNVQCPSCGQSYSIEASDSDRDITCQVCKSVFTVSNIAKEAPVAKAPSSPPPPIVDPSAAHPAVHQGLPSSSRMARATTVSLLDRFMALLFRFGKTFASLLAVLCLLSVIASIAVFAFNIRTGMKVPTYDQIAGDRNADNEDTPTNTTDLEERRAIEKKFGDRVVDIIRNHKFDQDDYDVFIGFIQSTQPDHRQRYLSGLEKALESRDEAARENKHKALAANVVVGAYTDDFRNAEATYEAEKEEAKATRWAALGAVFVSCFMLFMMLIVPALLRIEENTRRAV